MSKISKPNRVGWNLNTEVCVDLKTQLRDDLRMKAGKGYLGILRRDVEIDDFLYDEHFTFREERLTPAVCKRNPRVYVGRYITITRKDDGTYRPNFRPIHTGPGFNVEHYASSVANELLWALEGLVEEE